MNAKLSRLKLESIPLSATGFDFDGVIADTAEAFLQLACEKYQHCSFRLADITNFELEHCLPVSSNQVAAIFNEIMLDSLATGVQPMPGAVATLSRFATRGQVCIITARPQLQPVFDWLDHFLDIPCRENIKVIATGDHNDKLRHIRGEGLHYFIDDRAETCIDLAGQGIIPVVYSHPWNQGRHNLPAVAGWQEISELVTIPGEQA